MKIFMVQVPTSHLGSGERVYPLGLSRLSSLIGAEHEKYGLDMNLNADPWRELKNGLETLQPDLVVFSFRNIDPLAGHQTSYLPSLRTAAKMARSLVPAAVLIVGGPAFNIFHERLMQEIPEIDYGLKGEGERAFPVMLSAFPDLSRVPGVVFRNGDRFDANPGGPHVLPDEIPEMDTQMFCPSDYLKGNRYVASMGIEGKRGCDLKCAYCVYPSISGSRLRLRDPVRIVDEMEELTKTHGADIFHFTDSVVNRPQEHFESVCREILRRKLRIGWTGFFREDTLTEENAGLAKDAGLAACYFSADALTEYGRKLLKKRLTKDQILRASRVMVKHNILTMCHFLVNLPFETKAHIQESKQMLEEILNIHQKAGNLGAVILNTVRLYPAATLTQLLIDKGLLDSKTDLLYPTYYNPGGTSHVLHELEARCHEAGVFSRLGMQS